MVEADLQLVEFKSFIPNKTACSHSASCKIKVVTGNIVYSI